MVAQCLAATNTLACHAMVLNRAIIVLQNMTIGPYHNIFYGNSNFGRMMSYCVCRCQSLPSIDMKSLENRLLKVCYVPATSAGLNRLLYFFAAEINNTNEVNKASGTCC